MEALEASQQPRRITPAQHDIIARNLSKWMIRDKCKVELACLGGDHEAREYIIQIRKSLSACGFVVEENGVLNLPETKDGPVSGIHFSVKSAKFPPKGAKDVIAALREAGIIPTFTQEQANLKEDRLYIFVGPKPLK